MVKKFSLKMRTLFYCYKRCIALKLVSFKKKFTKNNAKRLGRFAFKVFEWIIRTFFEKLIEKLMQ